MPRGGAVELVAAVCLRAILRLSELPLPLCVRQIQAMTREELADWWRLYVSKLAGLLESVEGAAGAQPAPDVMQQLQQLQREALFLHIRCSPVSRWLGADHVSQVGQAGAHQAGACCISASTAVSWLSDVHEMGFGMSRIAEQEAASCPALRAGGWGRSQGGGEQREQREALCGVRRGGPIHQRA